MKSPPSVTARRDGTTPPSETAASVREGFERVRVGHRPLLDVMIPGIYAWVVTVAWPLLHGGGGGLPYLFGAASLVALGATGWLVTSAQRLWSAVSMALFLTASALVWFVVEAETPSLGWIGSVGWAAFAVGWVRASGTRPQQEQPVPVALELHARRAQPRASSVLRITALVGSAAPWLFAWQVVGGERALLAQGLALLGSLYLLAAASELTSSSGPAAERSGLPWPEIARALAYGGLMVLGCWLTFF